MKNFELDSFLLFECKKKKKPTLVSRRKTQNKQTNKPCSQKPSFGILAMGLINCGESSKAGTQNRRINNREAWQVSWALHLLLEIYFRLQKGSLQKGREEGGTVTLTAWLHLLRFMAVYTKDQVSVVSTKTCHTGRIKWPASQLLKGIRISIYISMQSKYRNMLEREGDHVKSKLIKGKAKSISNSRIL